MMRRIEARISSIEGSVAGSLAPVEVCNEDGSALMASNHLAGALRRAGHL
jgi:hypothetical protein